MPLPQTGVKKVILDVNNAKSIRDAVAQLTSIEKEIGKLDKDILPVFSINIKAKILFPLITQLRVYPSKPKYPIKWKSEKQRKYVMMLLSHEAKKRGSKSIAYRRTNTLKRAWQYNVAIDPNTHKVTIRVYNDASHIDPFTGEKIEYARFVQGDIGLGTSSSSIKRYQKPIQPFHKDTGWQPAYPLIQDAFKQAIDEVKRLYKLRLESALK